ncbi:MAG: hypothetical protein EA398_14785 [Deltaproteobacteria bacterium]|nr:MAG: hypothetical protein EA398_14785 [Deltaproteobacteria bacterium]
MAADKKPVWVDEDAHRILKAWAKILKRPMVEVASELVLSRLDSLDPSAGLAEPADEAPPAPTIEDKAEDSAREIAGETDSDPRKNAEAAERDTATADAPAVVETASVDHDMTHGVEPIPVKADSKLRYFGGVHLVR